MLDWLEANFNPRVIFVVRHPGAVAASQFKATSTAWDFNGPVLKRIFFQYKHDEQLRKDYLKKYYEIFSEKLSPVEGYTLLWCIENILPIYTRQKRKRYVFFYEDIVTNPENQLQQRTFSR